jgi:hypothetical protein
LLRSQTGLLFNQDKILLSKSQYGVAIRIMPQAQFVSVKSDKKTVPKPVLYLLDRPASFWHPVMYAGHSNPVATF